MQKKKLKVLFQTTIIFVLLVAYMNSEYPIFYFLKLSAGNRKVSCIIT